MRASWLLVPALASACATGTVAPGGPARLGLVSYTLDGEPDERVVYDLPLWMYGSSAILDLTSCAPTPCPTVSLHARPAGTEGDDDAPEIHLTGLLGSYPEAGPLDEGLTILWAETGAFAGDAEIVVESLSIDGARGRMAGRFAATVCTVVPTDSAPPPIICRDLRGRFDTAVEVRGGGG